MPLTVKDILNAIPSRFDAEAAGDWKADIQFNFSHEDAPEEYWTISVGEGACKVTEGKVENPSATVNTAADTWIGMTTGSVNPMQAFMSGKLKVSGDMGAVMKLQNPKIFKREREKKTEE
jgi:putative sterol carrier protein